MNRVRGQHRIVSLDAARGFAVFAMVVAHTRGFLGEAPKPLDYAEGVLNDVAAPLFALVIGLTFTVSGPASNAARSEKRAFLVQTGIKALLLIGIGLLLDLRPSGVNVVLAYLGVAMLLALPLIFVRPRALVLWAVGLTAVVPGITTLLRGLATSSPELVTPPTLLTTLLDWLVLGTGYQGMTFLPLILVGIAMGRTMLQDRRSVSRLFLVSFVVFVPLEAWRVLHLPGTGIRGGYVEVLREAPLALAAFALIALLTDLGRDRVVRVARRVFEPFSVQGRLALSLYVLHVCVLMLLVPLTYAAAPGMSAWFAWPRGIAIQLGLVVLCWAFAAAWWRWFGTGPVERLLRLLSRRRGSTATATNKSA